MDPADDEGISAMKGLFFSVIVLVLGGCALEENMDNARVTFDGVVTIDVIGDNYPLGAS